MRAPDWDSALLADHRSHLRSESAQQAFDRMVRFAESLPTYACAPRRHGAIRDFRFIDPGSGEWPFALIASRQELLFYIRRPGLNRVPGGRRALQARFAVRENAKGEWKVSIAHAEDADSLCRLLFGAQPDQASERSLQDEATMAAIQERTDIEPGEKLNLVKSRRGQGLYRSNLEKIEQRCRVTGLLDRRHLRARHIKPWCECDDREKLDGFNGLLLSPHIDHLFERGYISFSDTGDLLVSRWLNPEVLRAWGVTLPNNVGPFRPEQCRYLAYHRAEVFEKERSRGELGDEAEHLEEAPVLRVSQ